LFNGEISREIPMYQEVTSSNWFLSIHFSLGQLLVQILFKHASFFEESLGRNISWDREISLE
jgi:hypothetical protein